MYERMCVYCNSVGSVRRDLLGGLALLNRGGLQRKSCSFLFFFPSPAEWALSSFCSHMHVYVCLYAREGDTCPVCSHMWTPE